MEKRGTVGWPADYVLETLLLSAHDCLHAKAAALRQWLREGSYVPPEVEAAPCLLAGDQALVR
jgi:hypothetical protein